MKHILSKTHIHNTYIHILVTYIKHAGSPLPKRLILSTHFISCGNIVNPLPSQVPQKSIYILPEVTEIGISARAEGEDSEAHVAQWTKTVD